MTGGAMTSGRVAFVGAVHEAVPALGVLIDSGAEITEVVTLPTERAAATSGFVDLEPLAAAHGIPVRRCADINSAESVQRVRNLRPDLMVVCGWTRLLSAELLGLPTRGVIGFHASLLPRFRGRAPVNWAILRGEAKTGNTMMNHADLCHADPGQFSNVAHRHFLYAAQIKYLIMLRIHLLLNALHRCIQ